MKSMSDRLRRIKSGEESYGAGTREEQILRYRRTVLVPAAVERIEALVSTDPGAYPEIDLLVSLSGYSPEVTVFASAFLRPKQLLVLASHKAVDGFNFIQSHVALPPSCVKLQEVDPLDPHDLYERVQKAVDDVKRFAVEEPRVVIDITGGKKSMTAGGALAAAQLDYQMCYIDGTFDSALRQSEPGTESLVLLDNPTKMFGDKASDAAATEFANGGYGAARQRFGDIAGSAPLPAKARFGRDLSALYQTWVDLDFDRLGTAVDVMRDRLKDRAYQCSPQMESKIEAQLVFLGELAAGDRGRPWTLNFFLLAEHYSHLERHEFAALLYYRTLESIFAQRLAELGLNVSAPRWEALSPDEHKLTAAFSDIAEQVYGKRPSDLPFTVGMVDAALLLYIMEDPFIERFRLGSTKALKHLRGLADIRNRSILAHGTKQIGQEDSRKLGDFALRGLRELWKLSGDRRKIDDQISELRFAKKLL